MRLCEYDYEETHLMMGTASQYCLRWNNHQTNLLNSFDSLLRQEAFTDVTLACEEGVTLHAHRLVLAACSSYFSNLFSTTSPLQHPIVVLKDVRESEMRALLSYMYRGEVNVEQSQLKELLKVAEGLRVKGLVEDLVSNTQTHPLPLCTSSSQPLPLLVTSSSRHTSRVTPSPTLTNTRIAPASGERWEIDPPYSSNNRRNFHSPPPSPYKRPKIECKEEPDHIRGPSPHPYFAPYLSQHANLNQPPRVPSLHLDHKEHRTLRETYEREKIERPVRSPSDDRRERRLSPLSIPQNQNLPPYSIPAPELSPPKRSRQLAGDSLISPTPMLRNALAHTRSFQPDVSSLVSLANSMISLPPLLSARTQAIATCEELRRATDNIRDPVEQPYNLQLPRKSEPLSDDDSKQYMDIIRDDEPQDKISNGPLISDYTSYHLDSTNPSHFSNFVSYVPAPKPEWKRYKQYTKSDLMQAIEAVKEGETALQASRKYKVPSRTLYDKIKKMGINTIPRRLPSKRSSTTDIDINEPLPLQVRHLPSGAIDGVSSRELYSERSQSRELADSLPVSSIEIHASVSAEGQKKGTSDNLAEDVISRRQGDSVLETSTRGSFSLVGTKVFAGDDTSPLDLTDTDNSIPTRPSIQERA